MLCKNTNRRVDSVDLVVDNDIEIARNDEEPKKEDVPLIKVPPKVLRATKVSVNATSPMKELAPRVIVREVQPLPPPAAPEQPLPQEPAQLPVEGEQAIPQDVAVQPENGAQDANA